MSFLFRRALTAFLLLSAIILIGSCRNREAATVTIALTEAFSGLDTISSTGNDAAADRIRTLMFNSLVKKTEKFEYVGDIGEYKISDDGLVVTFTLRDNIKFHNGKQLTSADVKYTFDSLFAANGTKAGSFFDVVPDPADPEKKKTTRVSHFSGPIETPDAKTVVFRVTRVELVNKLLSNLVTIPIIPEGTAAQQPTTPIGSGPFKFVAFDKGNNLVQLEGFTEYWEGAPKILKLNVKTVGDANALQNELLSGAVDIAPNPTILSPDALNAISQTPSLRVDRFPGSNIQYIGFNVKVAPFDNVKVRQAIAYAIDREKIVNQLFGGKAKLAASILPEESWAYSAGTTYNFDPVKAKALLAEAGYKGTVAKLRYAAGNQATNQYAQLIQSMLKDVGFNLELETFETQALATSLKAGQFQMNTGQWIGGNQDPIFYRDLFSSTSTPENDPIAGRNRGRYTNPEFDKVIDEAVRTLDKTKARELYVQAQAIVSRDLPLLPLWYPSGFVVTTARISNVKMNASGDWGFVKDIIVAQ